MLVGGLAEGAPSSGQFALPDQQSAVFTPRSSGIIGAVRHDEGPGLEFGSDAIDAMPGSGIRYSTSYGDVDIGIGALSRVIEGPADDGESAGHFAIGGVLSSGTWSLGASYDHVVDDDGAGGVVSAEAGYGPVTTRLSFGQYEDGRAQETSQRLSLSTDVSITERLSVGGAVDYGGRDDQEPDTTGRIGLKLRF
jgi:hypothetical protein